VRWDHGRIYRAAVGATQDSVSRVLREIEAFRFCVNPGEFSEIADERNVQFGLQLSQDDKRNMARRIYHLTPAAERDAKKAHLAKILSISERTVRDWLSRIDKDSKDARNKRIFDLWLACYTQQEIADAVGVHKDTVNEICRNSADLPESDKPAANHHADFTPPFYNVWKQQTKTNGKSPKSRCDPGSHAATPATLDETIPGRSAQVFG